MALLLVATTASCGRVAESRLNPMNWFGRSENTVVSAQPVATDPRNLVSQVLSLRVEQVPGGAIVHATGLPPRQGFYNGELVQVSRGAESGGVLSFEFRTASPFTTTRVGTQQSREVIVGRFVSQQTLGSVSQIRVTGARNALTVRR